MGLFRLIGLYSHDTNSARFTVFCTFQKYFHKIGSKSRFVVYKSKARDDISIRSQLTTAKRLTRRNERNTKMTELKFTGKNPAIRKFIAKAIANNFVVWTNPRKTNQVIVESNNPGETQMINELALTTGMEF